MLMFLAICKAELRRHVRAQLVAKAKRLIRADRAAMKITISEHHQNIARSGLPLSSNVSADNIDEEKVRANLERTGISAATCDKVIESVRGINECREKLRRMWSV